MTAEPETLVIRAARAVAGDRLLQDVAVRVASGRIVAVDSPAPPLTEPDATVLACDLLLPGFVDMHAHGLAGFAFSDGASAAREASHRAAASGVTTWYAGLGHGDSFEAIAESVAAVADAARADGAGARLAGIFLEGPYISPARRGAWPLSNLRAPSLSELARLIDAARGHLRRINVAPELPGAIDFIHAAREAGIVVSIGHSDASYEQALAAFAAGATIANHTFNAMSGLHHREPGLVGAVLDTGSVLAELILDGVHVHPAAARTLYRAKGAAGVALVTDASALAGLADGAYEHGGRQLTVADGSVRLPDGTLAGSASTFDHGLRNAAAWLTAGPGALAMLSSGSAARAMGIAGEASIIAPGWPADLALLDAGLRVIATIVGGRVVYRRQS